MGGKAEVVKNVAHFLVVVAFVQAHSLRFCLCRFGPVYYDPRESQFHIMAIGSLDLHRKGHSMPLCKHTAFHAALAAIGGIGTGFFPAQRSFGHGPIHAQPIPIDPTELIKLLDTHLPQFEEYTRLHPDLEAIVSG